MSKNPVFHEKSKHIEMKYHYIRDMVQIAEVKLHYVVTDEQIAEVLTKPLARVKFEYFREKVFSRSRFPPKGSDDSMSHSDMVIGLVPSIVRYKCKSLLTL